MAHPSLLPPAVLSSPQMSLRGAPPPCAGDRRHWQQLALPSSWLSAPSASRTAASARLIKAPQPAGLEPGPLVLISWACQRRVHTCSWPGCPEPTPGLCFLPTVYSQALATAPRPGHSHLEATPGSRAASGGIAKDSSSSTRSEAQVLFSCCFRIHPCGIPIAREVHSIPALPGPAS